MRSAIAVSWLTESHIELLKLMIHLESWTEEERGRQRKRNLCPLNTLQYDETKSHHYG